MGIAQALAAESAGMVDDVAAMRLLYLVSDVLDAHDTMLELGGAE